MQPNLTPSERQAPPPEPPPPLGSWTRFYLLVAIVHVLVVTALYLFTRTYAVPPGLR